MKQRYIVLGSGDQSAVVLEASVFSPLGAGAKLAVSVAELSDAEAVDLKNDPDVASVAPAEVPLTLIAPTVNAQGSGLGTVWGLDAVGALTSPRRGQGIRVAVLDTGIKLEHEAFSVLQSAGKIVARNFTKGDPNNVSDTHGHGTHCAGTIAGSTVSGQRIGVAPDLDRLIVGKVLGVGGGTNEVIVEAIQWAVAQNANIVSMSLGIDFPGEVERWVQAGLPRPAAISRALKQYRDTVTLFGKLADFLTTRNVLLVAATGNESSRPAYSIDVSPPAASEYILKVGAIGRPNGTTYPVANFSNAGPDVVGPGVDIVSASHLNGLVSMNGTSMATPHVAGVAALWAEKLVAENGTATYQDIKAEVLASAQHLNDERQEVGRGLVQAPQ